MLSEDFPAVAGFRAGSLLAGYRLEAQVARAGWPPCSGPAMSGLAGWSH